MGRHGGLLERRRIRIGHRDVSVPFSYLTDDGKPIGFFMDICARVVDTIKADLKQDVKVALRPVTLSTQIPLLQNQGVSDSTYAKAVARFGEQGTIELVTVAAYYTYQSMVLNTARTPVTTPPALSLKPLP